MTLKVSHLNFSLGEKFTSSEVEVVFVSYRLFLFLCLSLVDLYSVLPLNFLASSSSSSYFSLSDFRNFSREKCVMDGPVGYI